MPPAQGRYVDWRAFLLYPVIGYLQPVKRPIASPLFEVRNFPHHLLATIKPPLSEIDSNFSLVASCRSEQSNVSGTTAVTSQCHTIMTSHSKYYEFPKPWVGQVKLRQNHQTPGKYWLDFAFLTSRDRDRWPLTPIRMSGGPYSENARVCAKWQWSRECNPGTPVECVSLSVRTQPCVLAFITYIFCTNGIQISFGQWI